MNFKLPKHRDQFNNAPLLLKHILYSADEYCKQHFHKELTVTRVNDPVDGESGVHPDYRGVDCRDEFLGHPMFTMEESMQLVNYINDRFKRNDGYKTCIHHSFDNGPKHFHFQISVYTKTYMPLEEK